MSDVTVSTTEMPVTVDVQETTVVVTVSGEGPQGPKGETPAVPPDHFRFDQAVASNKWKVVHNLGKYPSVLVQDSANSEIEGDIEFVSVNELIINFGAAFSGTAYLN